MNPDPSPDTRTANSCEFVSFETSRRIDLAPETITVVVKRTPTYEASGAEFPAGGAFLCGFLLFFAWLLTR